MSNRVLPTALALALAFPLSGFADSRSPQRTDMRKVAADLQRALGIEHVEIEGDGSGSAPIEQVDNELQPYVDAMNRERLARGQKALHLNRELCAAANDRIRDMYAQHYFEHDAPDGTEPFVWVTREGYDYQEVGENLAVGYRGAAAVVDGWMHSKGHRDNILNAAFDDVGIAVAPRSPTRRYDGPLVVALYGVR